MFLQLSVSPSVCLLAYITQVMNSFSDIFERVKGWGI